MSNNKENPFNKELGLLRVFNYSLCFLIIIGFVILNKYSYETAIYNIAAIVNIISAPILLGIAVPLYFYKAMATGGKKKNFLYMLDFLYIVLMILVYFSVAILFFIITYMELPD